MLTPTPSRLVSFGDNKMEIEKRSPRTYQEGLTEIMNDMATMLVKKHHDYGIDNLKKFGEFGILIRCSDKVERLNNVLKNEAAVAETCQDTWMDLAGYALQALMMARGYFELPE